MARNDKHIAVFTAYEDTAPWDPSNPEKNLLRAMLVTAMADIKKKGKVQRLALEYFSNEDDTYPFSFRSICNFLDIDPKDILRSLGLTEEMPIPYIMVAELAPPYDS